MRNFSFTGENLIGNLYNVFTFFFALLLIFAGFGLIVFAIYAKIKDCKIRKNGTSVRLKVTKVQKITSTENSHKLVHGYSTTFTFEYTGVQKEETITTNKKFKVGSIQEGIYFTNAQKSILILEESFLSARTLSFCLIFATLLLLIASYILFEFSAKILIFFVLVGFAICFLLVLLPNWKQRKKTVTVKEYSSVDSSLVRYIPTQTSQKKSFTFLSILLLLIGSTTAFIGVAGTFQALQIKFTYPSTMGEISKVYSYEQRDSDGVSEYVGVVYHYVVNGTDYTFEDKTGQSPAVSSYKVGQKKKIYYTEENPKQAIPQSQFARMVAPFILGMLFVYLGIRIFVNSQKKKRLYEAYLLTEEK